VKEFTVRTRKRSEFVEITSQVQTVVTDSLIQDGVCIANVPHTTAGITINENADPDVVHDMIGALDKIVPWESRDYRHSEGNSAAHVKASIMGSSVHVPVVGGRLQFGTWQGIYLCEFDGPRTRKVWVQVVRSDE
jgi:secondary thiamine-phosphate synthase enzyme